MALAPAGVDAVLDCAGSGSLPDLVDIAGSAERVVTVADLNSALAGDRIVLADGEYGIGRLRDRHGTEAAPIVVVAANRGQAVISGGQLEVLARRTWRSRGSGATDISAEPLVGCTGMGADWTSFWRLEPRPDNDPAPLGPIVAETYDDKLEAIVEGTAVAVIPAHDRRFTLRPELVTVPLHGIEPCQVVVATRAADTNPLVPEFVRFAESLLVGNS
ncbi:hypothetical protein KIPE111705_25960 [Kibdelosporangium persicum]|uniref:LysR substrate binding domain-containing protein n=1 Tax=Kibdelosporangium persicum TaxID=2698649 RepID=A0ABX2FJV1_9PSEU|nr:hypothetical protein [Kibdelosporangium persicum]